MTRVRIGVIGAAGRGEMARLWHDPKGRSVVVGAADVSDVALDSFQKNVNEKGFVTKDHRELLARKDIDAIAVMSPDFTHEKYVCDAFDAGKHVFTEKPMAITTEGCDLMLQAWIAAGQSHKGNVFYTRPFQGTRGDHTTRVAEQRNLEQYLRIYRCASGFIIVIAFIELRQV